VRDSETATTDKVTTLPRELGISTARWDIPEP
jgi:hypothetical protein